MADLGGESPPALPPGVFAPELPPMVSYAQNGEDVVLRRALHDIAQGFYVDIGAADPRRDSVTHHFVLEGWTGVDVEPQPDHAADLRAARPANAVIEGVVGATAGTSTLHVVPAAPGRSTTVKAAVDEYRRMGVAVEPLSVPVLTLAEICRRHRPEGPIHFLKVDAEGSELDVIAGGDWERFRPWIVVIEVDNAAAEDDTVTAAMVQHGYRQMVYDGLNRFFLAVEHLELTDRLTAPANINDAAAWYVYTDQISALQSEIAALRASASPAPEARSGAASGLLDRIIARSQPARRWVAPPGSRRDSIARRILRRPSGGT